jgi:plastocyanin
MFFATQLFTALASLALVRAAEIAVTVGGTGILQFNPNSVTANPGDIVSFTFKQKNHTATQSSLTNPCVQAPNGFDSGFVPVADTNTNGPFPIAQFTVQDTNPVWVFCRQADHCQQGMVFAINPGSNFPAFQAAATGNSSSSTNATYTTPAGGSPVTSTYGSSPSAASPTATTTDHQVVVGGTDKLYYSPANITAQAGDTVTFQFMVKNHTVTQSSFASPCRALTATSTSGQVGFDSGFMPVAANATTFPTYTIQVNDTAPIWAYCRQATHCGSGMVFAVNAVESSANNFAAFQAKAIQLNGTASSTASGSSATSTASSGSSSKTSGAHGRRTGHAPLQVGVALLGAAAGVLLF